MTNEQDIRSKNDLEFQKIAFRVLKQAGFKPYSSEKKVFQPSSQQELMKKDENIYCVETFYSRRELYTSRAILTAGENLIRQSKKQNWLPLIVVGGMLAPVLQSDLLGKSIRTVILDIGNLLYMAWESRELYDELVALLPYSVGGLRHREPDFLPIPDWNAAYAGKDDWNITASALHTDKGDTVILTAPPVPDISADGEFDEDEWIDEWDGAEIPVHQPEKEKKPAAKPNPGPISVLPGMLLDTSGSMRPDMDMASVGALVNLLAIAKARAEQEKTESLRKDIQKWQGGKQTSAAAYEKLCTRTLMRLFADDLTLWKEQARSNDDLFRFDLICKIKRDNHKDFWEMAERYFNSKYIIFEFKNYAGKVTQKEVYTTVRYLYTKAMRGVAFIISPNGMDENAGKAIRGVLRDEGKLVLSVTNDELVHMLQMKEDGEDPADYLSDKLDELLIDLEK